MIIEQINSSISINARNKSFGKFSVIPIDESDLNSFISVHEHVNIEGLLTIRVDDKNELNSNVSIFQNDNINSKLTIASTKFKDIQSNIFIKPKNKSFGKIEVMQPLILTSIEKPFADSFIRDQIPRLNYGTDRSIIIGYSQNLNEIYRGFLSFNIPLEEIENYFVDKVLLKIKNSNYSSTKHKLNLYLTNTKLDEYGITWKNQPENLEPLNSFEVELTPSVNEIDITDLMREFIKLKKENVDFVITSNNEHLNQTSQFYSRESINSPELEFSYYDDAVQSIGIINIPSSIVVNVLDQNNISSNIYINSYWKETLIPSNISISRQKIDSSINIVPVYISETPSTMVVRIINGDDKETHLNISRRELFVYIDVLHRNDINSIMNIRNESEDSKISTISISRKLITCYINPILSNNLLSSMSIRNESDDSKISIISISRKSIEGNINIRPYVDMESNITINVFDDEDLLSYISISKLFIDSTISVTYYDDITSKMVISNPSLFSTIRIPYRKEKNISSKLKVRVNDDREIESTVNVFNFNEILSSVQVKELKEYDIISQLSVRVTDRDEIESIIRIFNFNDIISNTLIRRSNEEDVVTNIFVVLNNEEDLSSSLNVYQIDSLNSSITVSKYKEFSIDSTISIMNTNDVETNINVFVSNNLVSSIGIPATDFNDIESNILVNVKFINDIDTFINVFITDSIVTNIKINYLNHLESTINIQSDYYGGYVFIC